MIIYQILYISFYLKFYFIIRLVTREDAFFSSFFICCFSKRERGKCFFFFYVSLCLTYSVPLHPLPVISNAFYNKQDYATFSLFNVTLMWSLLLSFFVLFSPNNWMKKMRDVRCAAFWRLTVWINLWQRNYYYLLLLSLTFCKDLR